MQATIAGATRTASAGATVPAGARGLPRLSAERPAQAALIDDVNAFVYRVTRVVLASAHREHDPGNNDFRNLTAFCQRYHCARDRPKHRRRRWTTLFRRRALRDLFLVLYR